MMPYHVLSLILSFEFFTKFLSNYASNLKQNQLDARIYQVLMLYWQAMYQQLRLEPYAVHTTFQYAGTEGKRHRLREGMYFYDPPEYYDSPGNIFLPLMIFFTIMLCEVI